MYFDIFLNEALVYTNDERKRIA